MSDKVCYTALFGNYEELKTPKVVTEEWKYVCFTDQEAKSGAWQVVHATSLQPLSLTEIARVHKILSTQDSDQSIWLDASFTINTNLNDFWNKHYKGGITVARHPVRNCAYKEAEVCIKRGLDAENVLTQITRYKSEGMPYNNGLAATGILMMDNSERVNEFRKLWWQQIEAGSVRDQIGFAYCDWKMPGVVNYFNFDYRTSKEFVYEKHYHRR